MKYTYLVSYTFETRQGETGVGRHVVDTHWPIDSAEKIEQLEHFCAKKPRFKRVILMSFQLLKTHHDTPFVRRGLLLPEKCEVA